MNEETKILEGQIRECYGRVVYSHKTHEKCADILLSRLRYIKICQIVLSALTTGGILSTFFVSCKIGAWIGVVLSAFLLSLNSYTKDYDMAKIAQKHKQAALQKLEDMTFSNSEIDSLLPQELKRND